MNTKHEYRVENGGTGEEEEGWKQVKWMTTGEG